MPEGAVALTVALSPRTALAWLLADGAVEAL
jgi:hypothetical protein